MPKRKNKIILDTNVWISYFTTQRAATLVEWVVNNSLAVYSSPFLIAELIEVLSRPKFTKYLTSTVDEYIDLHLGLVTVFPTTPIYMKSPDVKDNFLFDLALQANVPTIVTGDKKLLAVQDVKGVNFISLSAFKDTLK